MKKYILPILFFAFSISAFADCPEFEVNITHNYNFGTTPNNVDLYAVSLSHEMGFGHYQYLTIIYFDSSLLPQNILHCYRGDEDYYIIDDTEVSNGSNALLAYGIYTIFPSTDSSVSIELLEDGTSFQIENQTSNIYSGEGDLDTYLYTWEASLKSYAFKGKKSLSTPNQKIEAMKTSIASGDFDELVMQLKSYDFGGGYGNSYNKLPKVFSKNLWSTLHEKTLALYKKGHKKEAALLVNNILKAVPVSPSEGLYEYLAYPDDEYWLNYGVDALYENPKLLTAISDCAFFLEQGDLGIEEATAIFNLIVKKHPNRAATYLNLADSFWKLEKFEKAKINYQTYVELLLAKDKGSLIPAHVYKRLDRLKRGE